MVSNALSLVVNVVTIMEPVRRREPLSHDHFLTIFVHLHESPDYDDLLFLTLVHVGFETLPGRARLGLGEKFTINL
jgi:hypothetical protein